MVAVGARPELFFYKSISCVASLCCIKTFIIFFYHCFCFAISLFFYQWKQVLWWICGPLNIQLLKSFGDSFRKLLDELILLLDKCDSSIYKIELKLNKAQQSLGSIIAQLYTCIGRCILWWWAYFLLVSNFDLLLLFFWHNFQYFCNRWRSVVTT